MRTLNASLLLFLALCLGTPSTATAQIAPGSCLLGTAAKDLDVNQVRARVFNTGSLFYSATTDSQYIAPQSSGNSPIFASGIWIGGLVDGDLRTAGSRYEDFEFWPGPLRDNGSLPNPSDCSEYDRIYKVSARDIADYEAGTSLDMLQDLRDWPAELGAPVFAALDNKVDDDGDGLVDEGTNGEDDDGDGAIDERDEQERVTCVDVDGDSIDDQALDGGSCYDLEGGDRPDIVGDQSVWWVMNDVGSDHDETGTPPIGVEVRVQAFAFDRDNALGNTTFYRYTIEYKGSEPLEEAFLSVFSDPDLGDAGDDYVGSDVNLSLGYTYNANRTDATYGIPPAVGYDFFQGPVVEDQDGDGIGDTLGLTSFMYFINGGPTGTEDPAIGQQYYNVQQGLWRGGEPLTAQGLGYQTAGDVTKFAYPGDPVTGEFWSEVNSDGSGGRTNPGDRRLVVSTGPFTIEPGDVQDIVFGIVFAQGGSNLSSILALRAADITAQAAYDLDFEVPSPPPAPRRCGESEELTAGSGNCLEAVEVDGGAALVWGYPENSPNFLGQFEGLGYAFEGFNIYQYPTSGFERSRRRLVATFDKINGIQKVTNTTFDLDLEDFVDEIAARGTDSGLQYFFIPQSDVFAGAPLVNYTDYYFGITAYAVNLEQPLDRVLESSPTQITLRPSRITATGGGSLQQSGVGQVVVGDRIGGEGIGAASATVIDPTRLTGGTYTVEIVEVELPNPNEDPEDPDDDTVALLTYNVSRDGVEIFSGERTLLEDGLYVSPTPITTLDEVEEIQNATSGITVFTGAYVIDGLQFVSVADPARLEDRLVPGFAGEDEDSAEQDAGGIVEVATPGGDVCDSVDLISDEGCQFYGGNTVWLDPDTEGQYVVTNLEADLTKLSRPGNDREALTPEDYEMRFTDACTTTGACLGVYASILPGDGADQIVSVPFELWNIGEEDGEGDDIRMIPLLRPIDGTAISDNWANTFPDTIAVPLLDGRTLDLGVTQRVLWLMPDRDNGYDLFAEAANGFGGVGGTYDPKTDGDTQIEPGEGGGDCRFQDYYINFCYKLADRRIVAPIGGLEGMIIADLARDGTTPAAGTTIQFQTVPKGSVLNAGDQFAFNTAGLAVLTDDSFSEEALDMIGVVPNPYRGRSAYETGNADRRVRFTNLPPQVTIRIYTVSGTLIRTLNKSGANRSLDWDLTTTNNLPVASGMYLIHVQARNSDGNEIGERVLKLGVINRQIDVDVF